MYALPHPDMPASRYNRKMGPEGGTIEAIILHAGSSVSHREQPATDPFPMATSPTLPPPSSDVAAKVRSDAILPQVFSTRSVEGDLRQPSPSAPRAEGE